MNVLEHNKDHSPSILILILAFIVISVSEPSHKQKTIWEKTWKDHFTFLIQKVNFMYSKWNWNENLGRSGG